MGEFPVRHAFEFRHKSFLNKDFLAQLREYNVAIVFAHAGSEKVPYTEEPTAHFTYARLHGEGKPYANGYPDKEIARWAKKLTDWNTKKRDTFVYFSNEAKVSSPMGAMKLLRKLDVALPAKIKKAA